MIGVSNFHYTWKQIFDFILTAICYDKAKNKLWGMTKNYLYQHFEKTENSRAIIFPQYSKKGELINKNALLELSFNTVISKQFVY